MKIIIGPLKFHYVCCVGCFACTAVLCTPDVDQMNDACKLHVDVLYNVYVSNIIILFFIVEKVSKMCAKQPLLC